MRLVAGCFVLLANLSSDQELKDWPDNKFIEVGPSGRIATFTILRYAFIDPETGEPKPVPYGYGFIRLDGADNLFQHYIHIEDEAGIKIGARVEPVFSELRKGTVKDILYFRVAAE